MLILHTLCANVKLGFKISRPRIVLARFLTSIAKLMYNSRNKKTSMAFIRKFRIIYRETP